jgi:glucosyl-dolichyl phosphate glucuronosyltransferase
MAISVVIATRNRAQTLTGTLAALVAQDRPPDDFEVIVADNGSTDATPDVCASFAKVLPGLRLIQDPRPGQLVGWHRALFMASGDVLAFIDDDVRPEPGWAAAVQAVFVDERVGLATGPITPLFEVPPPEWQKSMILTKGDVTWSALWGALDCGAAARDIPADFVWGSNFLVRKTALLAVRGFHPGGMPATLFRFTGDGDVAAGRPITAAGWRSVYAPEAAVRHLMPAARGGTAEVQRWIYGEGLVMSYVLMRHLAAKHPGVPSADLVQYVNGEMPPERIAAIGRGYLRQGFELPQEIRRAFETAGPLGFQAHQQAFASDAAFRDWVLRPDYLDLDACYTHPELAPGAAR